MKRITAKFLEPIINLINQNNHLIYNQKGFLRLNMANGYYQLYEICKNNSSAVNQLTSGSTKDIYDYLINNYTI